MNSDRNSRKPSQVRKPIPDIKSVQAIRPSQASKRSYDDRPIKPSQDPRAFVPSQGCPPRYEEKPIQSSKASVSSREDRPIKPSQVFKTGGVDVFQANTPNRQDKLIPSYDDKPIKPSAVDGCFQSSTLTREDKTIKTSRLSKRSYDDRPVKSSAVEGCFQSSNLNREDKPIKPSQASTSSQANRPIQTSPVNHASYTILASPTNPASQTCQAIQTSLICVTNQGSQTGQENSCKDWNEEAVKAKENQITELTQTVTKLQNEMATLEIKNSEKMSELQRKLDLLCDKCKAPNPQEVPSSSSHPQSHYEGNGSHYDGNGSHYDSRGSHYNSHGINQSHASRGSQYSTLGGRGSRGSHYNSHGPHSEYASGSDRDLPYMPRTSRRQEAHNAVLLEAAIRLVRELDFDSLKNVQRELRHEMINREK